MLNKGQGSNSKVVRDHNQKTVIHLLRLLKQATRSELAEYTQLTSQSLAKITGSLEEKNLIVTVGRQINTIGQPSYVYQLNPEGTYAIGCNIDRKNIDLVLINFTGEICYRATIDYHYPEIDEVIGYIGQFVENCKVRFPHLNYNHFSGMGISIPYYLNEWETELNGDSHTINWDHHRFEKAVQSKFDYPVFFENDVNAATMATMIMGKGNQFKNYFYFYIGTFIGGGVVMDRQILSGLTGNAGNMGTLLVNIDPRAEIYSPDTGTTCQLLSYASVNTLKKFLTIKGLKIPTQHNDFIKYLSSQAENPEVKKWVDCWIHEASPLIAQAILNCNSILDFDRLILDGTLPKNLLEKIGENIVAGFKKFNTTGLLTPNLIIGDLGKDALVMGGAMIPFYKNYVPKNFLIHHDAHSYQPLSQYSSGT